MNSPQKPSRIDLCLAWALLLATVLGLLFTLSAVGGCAGPSVYPRHPFSDQILVPRAGHTGLTNGACPLAVPNCPKVEVVEYKFEDAGFRDLANRLNFICRIGGKRYKICKDKPGLCRITYKKKLFAKDERIEEYLPMPEQYPFLLAGNAVCFNEDKYNLQGW